MGASDICDCTGEASAERSSMGEFLERIGQRTFRSSSSWWYEVQPRVALSFPYYRLIQPPRQEIEDLMGSQRLRALRYPAPLEGFGFPSAVELNTEPGFSLQSLEREARRETRRGLEACQFQQIDFDYLREHGIRINRETAERQGRQTMYTDEKFWAKYCDAGKATPGVAAWGVMVGGVLGTYLVGVECDGWWNWLLTHSLTAYLKQRTSNVLFFEGPRRFFEANPNGRICYGIRSLEEVPMLDRFKVHMGVQMKPIKQRLVFSKPLRCASQLLRGPSLGVLQTLFPKSYTVRKASAMLRLYQQQTRDRPEMEGSP